jgi:putative DNA primase/helicase
MSKSLWISVGKNRKDTRWKNVQLSWEDLATKLRQPKVTAETAAEYRRMGKDSQATVKDVGGYVGGVIVGGRRLASSVQSRSLITLDADSDCQELWDDFCLTWNCAGLAHATHKSAASNLRLRLIIPLDRDVHTDEYEAIARKVADTIGLNYFDPTTFQPERLMYWPSVSKDVEYYVREQRGPTMCADQVLAMYNDWHDMSQWPLHASVDKEIAKELGKQEDPTTKEGIVGAFCRTYTVSEVIEKYLSEVYLPTSRPDRFTYKHGSTAAGVVVYDDLFSYSHHSTDPTSMKLCNAFDLLRLSLFSDADVAAHERTNATKLPSYQKVCELILKDEQVKQHLIGEKMAAAKEEFADVPDDEGDWTGEEAPKEPKEKPKGENNDNAHDAAEDAKNDKEWLQKLDVDKHGNCYNTTQNVVLILKYDPKLKNKFQWDEFNHRMRLNGSVFWRKVKRASDAWVIDSDMSHLRHYFETVYNINAVKKIEDGLTVVAMRNKIHPILDYLKGLQWDNVERLDNLLIDYLGAEPSAYVKEVTRKTLVAAVTRVFEPGTKFDNMLMLVGPQGIGKSQLINRLGGAWYSDTFGSLQNKEAMEQLQGVWLMELGELAGLKKAEIETIKLFVAKQEDRFRVAYGQLVNSFPRQCVFIGTTNEDEFLQDPTGNRRFWPVEVGERRPKHSVFSLDERTRGQIWAEACYYYGMGEDLYLTHSITEMAEAEQEKHTEQESYYTVIEEYLYTPISSNWSELNIYDRVAWLSGDTSVGQGDKVFRTKVTILEIWLEAIRGKVEHLGRTQAKSIKNSMKKMKGWEYKVIRVGDKTERGWCRKTVTKVL